MATKKAAEEPEAQDVEEPDRVVDPPAEEGAHGPDPEAPSELQMVQATQSAILTLPSGASYNFSAGVVQELPASDVDFMVENGYGTRVEPDGE
jgi:hypothetical protein